MTAYAAIPNTDIDADSPITVSLMTAMRDNPIAIAEGTSPAPRVVGANLVELSVADASASATIDFTGLDGTYDVYIVIGTDVVPATDNVSLQGRVGTGATPTWQTSSYSPVAAYLGMQLAGTGSAAGEGCDFEFRIFRIDSTTQFKRASVAMVYNDSTGVAQEGSPASCWNSTTAVTAIRFYFSAGNIESGRFALYGVKNV